MNEGVEILLARMDSHPEEFDAQSPWDWAVDAVLSEIANRKDNDGLYTNASFMTDEELRTVRDKFVQLQSRSFTNKVMAQLLCFEEDNTMYGAAGLVGDANSSLAKRINAVLGGR